MAQQTQVARAEQYWRAWMARFPTLEDLAASSPADVLRTWRGLGYDRRALNLLRCARAIVAEHGGRIPSSIAELERLPGLGRYTARALAALAFGQRVGAVDVNVRRVVGRIVGGPEGPAAIGRSRLQAIADEMVPPDDPVRWTHALMDLGATICRIREPRCAECPARPWCSAADAWEVSPEVAGTGPARSGRERAARGASPPRSARERPVPFTMTRRWLRGRILDRLREADDDAWTTFDGPIGEHGRGAVEASLRTLAREGMIELAEGTTAATQPQPKPSLRARLPAR
jgi:adenine-specific DNA glycosylase